MGYYSHLYAESKAQTQTLFGSLFKNLVGHPIALAITTADLAIFGLLNSENRKSAYNKIVDVAGAPTKILGQIVGSCLSPLGFLTNIATRSRQCKTTQKINALKRTLDQIVRLEDSSTIPFFSALVERYSSIRSSEDSQNLIATLKSDTNTATKLIAFRKYMLKGTKTALYNDGKNLFNTALELLAIQFPQFQGVGPKKGFFRRCLDRITNFISQLSSSQRPHSEAHATQIPSSPSYFQEALDEQPPAYSSEPAPTYTAAVPLGHKTLNSLDALQQHGTFSRIPVGPSLIEPTAPPIPSGP